MKRIVQLKTLFKITLSTIFLLLIWQNTNAQTTICIETNGSLDQKTGTQNGYYYELWNEKAQGTACMELGSGYSFNCNWSGIQNYLARRGLKYDLTQTHQEIGNFTATYACTYSPDCSSGNSYLSIYGWTYNPNNDDLVEYYIIDNWCNWNPSMAGSATNLGSVNIDGSDYTIIKNIRTGPSIKGDRQFTQYFSIRENTRNSGTINITEHFNAWEGTGQMPMSYMHEVTMVVEGYQNSGTCNMYNLDFSVGESTGTDDIISVSNPTEVTIGETANVSVNYSSSTNRDIVVMFQEANSPWTTYGESRTTVSAGTGTVNLNLDIDSNTPEANGIYKFQTIITTVGGHWNEKLDNLEKTGIDATSSITYTDDIISVTNPGEVSIGETVDVNVNYSSSTDRDIVVIFQEANSPWTTYGESRTTVSAGEGTVNLSLNIDDNTPVANGVYKFQTIITTVGGHWNERLDNIEKTGIDAISVQSDYMITVRARGTDGSENINLKVGGSTIETWTLSKNWKNYSTSTSNSGKIVVEFSNDASGRDVQVDYVQVPGSTMQAEDQPVNTGVWQNGSCGGSYSEMMHCSGYIEFNQYKSDADILAKSVESKISRNFNTYFISTTNQLVVGLPEIPKQSLKLNVYNLSGQILKTFNLLDKNSYLDVNDLKTGLYILKINYEDQVFTKKFVKK